MTTAGDSVLDTAERVLRSAGFLAEPSETSQGLPILLAENEYFLLAVVNASSVKELIAAEESAVTDLVNRISASKPGPKQWDAYLVLLTQEEIPSQPRALEDLFAIRHNTRYVRRVAQVGVGRTTESVTAALRQFLPLPKVIAGDSAVDPLLLLEEELRRHGIRADEASKAVTTFKSTYA